MLAEDELRDAVLLVFANKQVRNHNSTVCLSSNAFSLQVCVHLQFDAADKEIERDVLDEEKINNIPQNLWLMGL